MENKTIIGYDFDGVIATELNTWWDKILWVLFPKQWAKICHRLAKHTGIIPPPGSFIITGRLVCEYSLTFKQCQRWGIVHIYIHVDWNKRKPNKQESIDWKVKMIQKLGITEFHENDLSTIKVLRKINNLKIIQYGGK